MDNLTDIKGIGDKIAKLLDKMGIHSPYDLVCHYPVSYGRYSKIKDISQVNVGENVAICGMIAKRPSTFGSRSKVMTKASIEDDTDHIDVIWFNSPYIASSIKSDTYYIFTGKVSEYKGNKILSHPIVYKEKDYKEKEDKFYPIYRLTKGITNNAMTKYINAALQDDILPDEYMPKSILIAYDLPSLATSTIGIHRPTDEKDILSCHRRIAFDEFYDFISIVRGNKDDKHNQQSNHIYKKDIDKNDFIKNLPFALTKDQLKACDIIEKEMQDGKIINRLIEGDVGSGKTVIAAAAIYLTYRNGYQSIFMAPTEVLANQHYKTISDMMVKVDNPPRITLLTGSMTKKERKEALDDISRHHSDIIIGTHALISEDVSYDDVGLVIADEQHRFGVMQRKALSDKGDKPHIISMSATPIPRTLATILYGDVDISRIMTKPAGRLPIKSCVIGVGDRDKAYKMIARKISEGRQAYVICPMVEESELYDGEDVISYADKIKNNMPSQVKIEYMHGKMRQSQKDDIMLRFARGKIDILVSTTVIEVGIDVPNSTVIMIENADRFGLATLHQLRGRVGRGSKQSYCIFVNTSTSDKAANRLKVVNDTNDGFEIAEADLHMRGPGDILGIDQSGDISFKYADIYSDADTLKEAASAYDDIRSGKIEISDKERMRISEHLSYIKKEIDW